MASSSDLMVEVQKSLDKLCHGVESLQDKQEEMADAIGKIKEAVYNPDEGLYARLRELESWKSTSSKMIWTLFTTMVGLISAFILKSFP